MEYRLLFFGPYIGKVYLKQLEVFMVFVGFIIFMIFLLSFPAVSLLFFISVLVGMIHPALGVALFFAVLSVAGYVLQARRSKLK